MHRSHLIVHPESESWGPCLEFWPRIKGSTSTPSAVGISPWFLDLAEASSPEGQCATSGSPRHFDYVSKPSDRP